MPGLTVDSRLKVPTTSRWGFGRGFELVQKLTVLAEQKLRQNIWYEGITAPAMVEIHFLTCTIETNSKLDDVLMPESQESVASISGIHTYRSLCVIEKYGLGQGQRYYELPFVQHSLLSYGDYCVNQKLRIQGRQFWKDFVGIEVIDQGL